MGVSEGLFVCVGGRAVVVFAVCAECQAEGVPLVCSPGCGLVGLWARRLVGS